MVVGFGYSLQFGGRDAFLDEFYLEAPLRGKGIGTQAMQHMIAACHSEGVHALHLEVFAGNSSAIAFYKRMGFTYQENMLMSRAITSADPFADA
jgi:GNAT superfamily N-acetyltransferase